MQVSSDLQHVFWTILPSSFWSLNHPFDKINMQASNVEKSLSPPFFQNQKIPQVKSFAKKKHTVNKIPQRKKHRHRKQNLPGDSKCPFHGLSWRSLNPLKWVTFSPSQKVHELKSPGAFFFSRRLSDLQDFFAIFFHSKTSHARRSHPEGSTGRSLVGLVGSGGQINGGCMEHPKTQAYTLDKPGQPGLNFTTGKNTSSNTYTSLLVK